MTALSPNFDARAEDTPIDMLVLHYTGMQSARDALTRLCDPEAGVSAHYLINEDGVVHRLVDEDKRAWHAGVAWWRGSIEINTRSIGIELVNPGHEWGYRPFPEAQMRSLIEISRAVLSRHPIPARNVVGHSDVAPTRKTDPGEFFDWARLAKAGIGLWPTGVTPYPAPTDQARAIFSGYGYEIKDFPATVRAFQRHFRPGNVTGQADPDTLGALVGLFDLIPT